MKRVLTHWVSMSTLEVPDECPTDNQDDFERWIIDNDSTNEDPFLAKGKFVSKFGTRDFEMVNVEDFESEEEKAKKAIKENYETDEIWNTEELQRDFTVIGFAAPFVSVIRKSDNKKGMLKFLHSPRFYFNFTETT